MGEEYNLILLPSSLPPPPQTSSPPGSGLYFDFLLSELPDLQAVVAGGRGPNSSPVSHYQPQVECREVVNFMVDAVSLASALPILFGV